MRRVSRIRPAPLLLMLGVSSALPVHADVTVLQKTTVNAAGFNVDLTSTELTTPDKQRRDALTQCHGFLALICGNVESADIIRLDKQLQWDLSPKRKEYTEHTFPTAEQRALAQQALQTRLDQLKKCPALQQQPTTTATGPDTSHCQMTPPKLDIKATNDSLTLLGHTAHRTSAVLSQMCTDTETHDTCEIDYGLDVWLTTDTLPGAQERRDFTKSYLTSQGLDETSLQMQGAMQQILAPYGDSLRQLQAKASNFKGYPLRTVFYMAFGGPQCTKAQKTDATEQPTATTASGSSAASKFGLSGLASRELGNRISGLFSRKGADADVSNTAGQAASQAANDASTTTATTATSAPVAPPAAPSGPTLGPNMVQVISLTTETTSIDTGAIPADQFEVPAGYKLLMPKPVKEQQGDVCPSK